MSKQQLTVGFIGCGAIGTVFAYLWQSHQCFNASLSQQYYGDVHRNICDITQSPHKEQTLYWPAWQEQPLNWLLVTTKAAHTLFSLQDIDKHLSLISRIVLIQNGMGQQELVYNWLKSKKNAPELWVGSTTNGAFKEQNTIYYAGKGETFIGRYLPNTIALPNMLPECLIHPEPMSILREKLAVNAVINTITAQAQCLNGELLTDISLHTKVQELCEEVEKLYQQLGWQLRFSLYDKVADIASKTASNRSSTLQDVQAQRPTELAYITGYLILHADMQGISIPKIKTLHNLFSSSISNNDSSTT
ncbi:MAG: 2-dehydropantoate 2-reductase [Gammaproteobacteria bacterium]|nr:2-dehydropantoate 2-reductase [Gammaproteobacteria bacterium]